MDFTSKELDVLTEVLNFFESQFDSELDAIAEVFDADDEYVDIEVTMNDDTTEQFKLERELLNGKLSAKAIAETIS